MPIPKKTRDAAMQLILDFHQHREPMHTIGPAYLDHNLKSDVSSEQIIETLSAMGLITYTKERDGKIYDIRPSNLGLHYFESEADEQAKVRKVFLHEWKIAVFSALAGALLSRPLWAAIGWLANLVHNNHLAP